MNTIIIIVILLIGLALFLRGDALHNHIVLQVEGILKQYGYDTRQECPRQLPDGRLDFVDLLAQKGNYVICIEIETSARHVMDNVIKANIINLPLIVVCPSQKVKKAVQKKLAQTQPTAGGYPIYVLLLAQLKKEVMNCFPLFSSANDERKNKKINHGD